MAKYTVQTEIEHKGLHKYKIIKASSTYELQQKAKAQLAQWDEQWKKKQEIEREKLKRQAIQRNHEENKEEAELQTSEAEEVQRKIDCLLKESLNVPLMDWNDIKRESVFPERQPFKPKRIAEPNEPNKTDEIYNPKLSIIDQLIKSRKKDILEKSSERYENDYHFYLLEKEKIEEKNKQLQAEYAEELKNWEDRKADFLAGVEVFNENVDKMKTAYSESDSEAINFYVESILERLEFPFEFTWEVQSEFLEDSKIMIIDLSFPMKEEIPTLKKVTYIKSREEMKQSYLSESQLNKKYEETIYQMVLMVLNQVFTNTDDKIDSIVLNGKIHTIDVSTGKEIEPYILSIKSDRKEFEELKLEALEPKAWFRAAKGISAAKISSITPIAPIIQLNKEDARFIDSKDVLYQVTEEVNLAEMDWQEFENLIRELFEQEFNVNGGEVKITQASRDGGVDAVAFDPDPIRGGKIVIQAKRYNNVVGVSAVRDLYGTVMNEGANKGILVSTSNYGNDAYNFAKDKPITLMNGANLLYLLEKHGHRATIQLKNKTNNTNS